MPEDPFQLQIGGGRDQIMNGNTNVNSDGIVMGNTIQPPGPLTN
jgi:hypothetical protein